MELRKVYDELNMRIDHVEQIAYAGGNEALWNQIKTADPASGVAVTISDAAPIYATNITADIEPLQSGSDTPSPSNIRTIYGYEAENITVKGANQWDEEWESGFYNRHTGEKAGNTDTKYYRCKNYISCVPSEKYFVKLPAVHPDNTTYFAVLYYDKAKNFISSGFTVVEPTITTPSNAYYLTFFVEVGTNGATYNNDIAINHPASVTAYEPYKGQDYVTTFPSTVYGGTLDVTSGKLVVTHGITTISDITGWTYGGGVFYKNGFSVAKYPSSTSVKANIISSGYNTVTDDDIIDTNNAISLDVTGRLCVHDESYSDASDFVTGAGDIQICYELATPTTYQLTPKQIKLLQGLNNLSASTGPITIKYQPDNALGYILGQAQEFALNSVYIAPALDTGNKIANFTIGNTSGVLYETPAPEQTTRRITKKSIKED